MKKYIFKLFYDKTGENVEVEIKAKNITNAWKKFFIISNIDCLDIKVYEKN